MSFTKKSIGAFLDITDMIFCILLFCSIIINAILAIPIYICHQAWLFSNDLIKYFEDDNFYEKIEKKMKDREEKYWK
jgi:hypothetical protein